MKTNKKQKKSFVVKVGPGGLDSIFLMGLKNTRGKN
jgi:hypothetical protein